MRHPHFRATRGSMEAIVSGTMHSTIRVIEVTVRTPDHVEADQQFDRMLALLKQDGWTIQLFEK